MIAFCQGTVMQKYILQSEHFTQWVETCDAIYECIAMNFCVTSLKWSKLHRQRLARVFQMTNEEVGVEVLLRPAPGKCFPTAKWRGRGRSPSQASTQQVFSNCQWRIKRLFNNILHEIITRIMNSIKKAGKTVDTLRNLITKNYSNE